MASYFFGHSQWWPRASHQTVYRRAWGSVSPNHVISHPDRTQRLLGVNYVSSCLSDLESEHLTKLTQVWNIWNHEADGVHLKIGEHLSDSEINRVIQDSQPFRPQVLPVQQHLVPRISVRMESDKQVLTTFVILFQCYITDTSTHSSLLNICRVLNTSLPWEIGRETEQVAMRNTASSSITWIFYLKTSNHDYGQDR